MIELKSALQPVGGDAGARLMKVRSDQQFRKNATTKLRLDQFDLTKRAVEFEASQSLATRATNKDRSHLNLKSNLSNTMARGFSPDIIHAARTKEERKIIGQYLEGYTEVGDGKVEFDDVARLVLKERQRARKPLDSSDDDTD